MSISKEKIICLVSGGIDSPVACALVARRFRVQPLYFDARPFVTEDSFRSALEALIRLKTVIGFKKATIFPWGRVLERVVKKLRRPEFTCLVCKRAMSKAAELVSEQEKAAGIATGEVLGQKASQTTSNLAAISSGIKFPILRPLLGLDKLEIERLSKKLGLWQPRHAGGCKALPSHPRTRASVSELVQIMEEVELNGLLQKSLEQAVNIRSRKGFEKLL